MEENSTVPSLSYHEVVGILFAAFLSPLWFFTIAGLNINPADILFLAVFVSFVLRTGVLPFSPSRTTGLATVIFLVAGGLSTLWTPLPLQTLTSFSQYLFIFVGVVPITSYGLRNRNTRWLVFIAVWIMTNGLALLTLFVFLSDGVTPVERISLWFGNRNQLLWLIASGCICNIAIILENSKQKYLQIGIGLIATLELAIIFAGRSVSATLVIVIGIWAFVGWVAQNHSIRVVNMYLFITFMLAIVCIGFIIQYWSVIYSEGSLYVRIPQYLAALKTGIAHFPLGSGLDSSSSVIHSDLYPDNYSSSIHNFFLSYFVEIGIIGAIAFLMIVIDWCRNVFISVFKKKIQFSPFDFAFIIIFGTYVFVIVFQPVPVHRYWWLMFGASWAAIQNQLH